MLLEPGQPDKPLQRRSPHLFDVLEPHVVGDQRHNLLQILVREAQPSGNHLSHPHAHVHVPVEADAVARLLSRFEGSWLTYVMQEYAPSQGWRHTSRELLDHQPGVDPDITLRMKLRRLLDPL